MVILLGMERASLHLENIAVKVHMETQIYLKMAKDQLQIQELKEGIQLDQQVLIELVKLITMTSHQIFLLNKEAAL